jgi:hypothetical protein
MVRLMVRCLLWIGVWLGQVNVLAQDAFVPAVVPATERRGEIVVRQLPLDAIYLDDTEGNRVLLPGPWPLNVVDEFYKHLLKDQQDQIPPFTIRNVSATGTVVGKRVEIDVQIELITYSPQAVRIPLGFREGILPSAEQTDKPSFRYTSPGTVSLTVDPQEEQYVAIVVPHVHRAVEAEDSEKSEQPGMTQHHILSLLLWIPFVQNHSGENRLPLSFPHSNSSQFLLEVPMSKEVISPSVLRGWLLDVQEGRTPQSTLLTIQGLRTDTEIVWERKRVEVIDDRPVLIVAQAVIDVHLDAQSTLYHAILPVSSATGSFDQLQIRLPQDCVLDREMVDRLAADNDYSVGEVNEESIVTVRFQQRTAGPVSLHLRATQQFEGDKPDFNRDLAGFEVLGAERQSGFLNVSVFPAEMRPHWESVRGVRRAEAVPASAGTAAAPIVPVSTSTTRFEFNSQPFLLSVRVRSPQTRINVRPEYQFHIRKGWIVMFARLSYTVSGSKAEMLRVRLPDSQWDTEFESSSLVDIADVVHESGYLTIPLRSPMEGTFDIEFQARRAIASDVSEETQVHRIVLPLPEAQDVSWSEPALVAVVSDKNVEVQPIDETYSDSSKQRMTGLTRQAASLVRRTMSMRIPLTDLQQEPLFYRTEPTGAIFVADLIYHQQRIKASMNTDVRLFAEENRVTQNISYEADYAPVSRLHFLIPRALELSGNIQVLGSDNRVLELRDTISDARDNIPDNWVRKLVQLPEPRFQYRLTFQYTPPPLTVATDDTAMYALSFVRPSEVPVSEHLVHFFTPSGYRVELQNESHGLWESYREPRRPIAGVTETFRSVQSPPRIALLISASERSLAGATFVERAWLQTWFTGSLRHDRATYLLRSTSDSVTLQLPPEVLREHQIFVQVQQRPIQPNISTTGVLTIPILPEQYNRPIEVTVDYRYTFNMSHIQVPVNLPYFAKETAIQQQFWQIMLPPDRHIIGAPEGWTLEYDWTWNGLFWWRTPSIRKGDLGFYAEPAAVEPTISESSQYVFRHLQPPPYVTLYIVSRSWIVLGASGIALFIGLVLIYVPQSRYAGSLFGLGVALIAVLLYQPTLVLLMLQAAVFGVFLALGTGYVYRIFHRQQQWIPPTFPIVDDISQPYLTPPPPPPLSQTIHEVIIDDESATGNKNPVENNAPS